MQGKNESVFLCPLEQDDQKNRANTLEEINCNSIVQSTSTQQNSPDVREKVLEDKDMRPTPSETNDLELLLREKAVLEEESRRLDEERKRLDLLVRMHLEELARETKKRNSEKRQAMIHLREQIGRLETQLGLEKSVQEKQKANIDLRARIGMLETQLRELSVLDISTESLAEKIDSSPYSASSEASHEELLDSDQNASAVEIAVEIIEEIK